jgi:hopanoid biosynthesis associated RND transporter like protein HpnN
LNRFIEEGLGRWVEFCERRPHGVLTFLVILTALTGWYVWQNFSIDSDLGKLIRPSAALDWHQANEDFKAQFPELQQTSIVVVSGADLPQVDGTSRRLTDAFRKSDRFEFVFAPALDDFFRDHRAYFLDPDDLDAWITGVQFDYGALLRLADGADLSNAAFTFADQVAATDGVRLPTSIASIAENFLTGEPRTFTVNAYPHLEPDAAVHYTIIMLKGQQSLDESLPNALQVELIRDIVGQTELSEGVVVRLTGEVPLSHEEISAVLSGIGIAGTVSLVLLALILSIGVRSWRIMGATFCLLGVGVVLTLGFATAVVGSFNTLALIFVVMFFGLGVDFAIHFSLRLWEGIPVDGEDPEVHVVHEIGPALLLCAFTSSIAFLSFAPTEYRGLAELGIVSAGGMAVAFLLTVSLLPALFSIVGLPKPIPGGAAIMNRWLSRVKPGLVLMIAVMVALISIWLARDLRFDFSVLALRDADTEAMSTLLELQDNAVTTDYSINILAEDAQAAIALKSRLEALEEVGVVLIPDDLVPAGQAAKHRALLDLAELLDTIGAVQTADWEDAGGDDAALALAIEYLGEVADEVQMADQDLFEGFYRGLSDLQGQPERAARLNQALRNELIWELDDLRTLVRAEPFTLTDLPEDLLARLLTSDGRHLVTVQPAEPIASREATERFVAAVQTVSPTLAGRAVVEWGVGDVAVRSFVQAVTLAIAAIGVLLIIYFRGILLPVVVLAPLALTTLITFAVLAVTPLTLNMANILVIPLIFGLGVDTGIHVVHRYTASRDVVSVMSSSTGRAVVISALTTIGTFFSLSFSPHKGAASVGMLLTISISIMLLTTFSVLPALLMLIKREKG